MIKLNPNISFIILIILFGIIIYLLILDVRTIQDTRTECLKNPLVYGAGELKRVNEKDLTCSCTFTGFYEPSIIFNDKKFEIKVIGKQYGDLFNEDNLNISWGLE